MKEASMHDLNTLSTWIAIRAQSDVSAPPFRSPGAFRLFPAGTSLRIHALRWLVGSWGEPPSTAAASPCSGPKPWDLAAPAGDRAPELS
jgi:hypothetical protein